MDYGRKTIIEIFGKLYEEYNKEDEIKELVEKRYNQLYNNADKKLIPSEVWNNVNERKKSNFDKVSFDILMSELAHIEILLDKNNDNFLNPYKLHEKISILQTFFLINEESLQNFVINNILTDSKMEGFLTHLLAKFDFTIPQKRHVLHNEGEILF